MFYYTQATMKQKDTILQEYEYGKDILGNQSYLAVYKKLIKSIGLIDAIILSFLYNYAIFFYSKESLDNNGYFYKSMGSMEIELNISSHIIRTSLKKLKALGLINYVRKDIPPKLYFYVNVLKIRDLLIGEFIEHD